MLLQLRLRSICRSRSLLLQGVVLMGQKETASSQMLTLRRKLSNIQNKMLIDKVMILLSLICSHFDNGFIYFIKISYKAAVFD